MGVVIGVYIDRFLVGLQSRAILYYRCPSLVFPIRLGLPTQVGLHRISPNYFLKYPNKYLGFWTGIRAKNLLCFFWTQNGLDTVFWWQLWLIRSISLLSGGVLLKLGFIKILRQALRWCWFHAQILCLPLEIHGKLAGFCCIIGIYDWLPLWCL